MIEFLGAECYVWWQSYREPGIKYRIPLDRYLKIAGPATGRTRDLVDFLSRCCEGAERLPMTPEDIETVRLAGDLEPRAAAAGAGA